jgi:hypothetical protein
MFDIVTSRDFLAKLEADFDDFKKEPHSARLALNCAITAYHLHEWVWGDWLQTDYAAWTALKIRDKETFVKELDKTCTWFSTVQQLTNGTKHFSSSKDFRAERVGAPPFIFDDPGAGFDVGAFDGPIAYDAEKHGSGHLLIDYGDGAGRPRWKTAVGLLDEAVRFWREFFARYYSVCVENQLHIKLCTCKETLLAAATD